MSICFISVQEKNKLLNSTFLLIESFLVLKVIPIFKVHDSFIFRAAE